MYDKRDEFKQLDNTILKDVRRAFNRAGIPFLWIAPVYDDGKGTKYRVAMDTNKEIKENIDKPVSAAEKEHARLQSERGRQIDAPDGAHAYGFETCRSTE